MGPGVVGPVAQDDAAGVAGDGGGDVHEPGADRPGLPLAGGVAGQGEHLGPGEDVVGQSHDLAPNAVPSSPSGDRVMHYVTHGVVTGHRTWEPDGLPCATHLHDVVAISSRHTKTRMRGPFYLKFAAEVRVVD